jgi:hypothetical protein
LRNDFGEPKGGAISRHRIDSHIRDLQNDEDRADHDTLKPTTENGVRDHREGLVDDHVGKEEGHKKKVTVLPDVLDFLCIALLFAGKHDQVEGSGGEDVGKAVRPELTVSR